jgi:hypothetical protein
MDKPNATVPLWGHVPGVAQGIGAAASARPLILDAKLRGVMLLVGVDRRETTAGVPGRGIETA